MSDENSTGFEVAGLGEAFDALPYIMIVIDKEGIYRQANKTALTTFGFDPAGLSRQEVSKRLNARFPDGRGLTPENMPSTRTLKGELCGDFEYLITDCQGQERWLLMNSVPLTRNGVVVGALLSNKDITQRRRVEEKCRVNETRFQLLAKTSSALLASPDPKAVVRELCAEVMAHLDCQVFISFRLAPQGNRLRLLASAGIPAERVGELEWLEFGDTVCGCVARDGQRIIAEDIQSRSDSKTWLVKSYGLKAYCCHPLSGPDGKLLGTLSFGTSTRTHFSEDEIGLMEAVADQVAMALQRDEEKSVLASSEASLRLFIEHAPASIAMLDKKLRFLYVSRRWHEEYKLGSRDLTGLYHAEVFPDIPSHWKEALGRALEGEVIRAEADRVFLSDGRIHYLRWEVRPWRDAAGEVAGIAVFTEDVTRHVTALEALRKSERLYRAIGESIDYGVWVCDPEGKNIYASESFLNLVGLTQEECSSFGWGEVLHPEDADRTIAAWKECVRTGGKWDIEHRFKGVDGKWHEILARGIKVKDDDGKVLCWAGINLDISAIKKAERSLQEAMRHLSRHMDNTPLAVVEWDADFRITRWAGAAEEIFGWSAAEAVGSHLSSLRIVHEDDSMKVSELVEEMKAGRITSGMNANRNYRRDGSVIHCEWYNSSLYDNSGKLQSTLSLVLDVSRRNLLEKELLAAKDRADSASRAKSVFLARMSHELRTPLNGITGMVELALMEGQTDKTKRYLELAKQSSKALLEIISDILDLSQIEAGRVALQKSPFFLRKTVDYLESFFGAAAGAKGVAFTAELDSGVPEVLRGDEVRLRQVMVNLLGNAIKFTAVGKISLRVGLSSKPPPFGYARLLVEVEDTGIGIGSGQLDSVFESYSQATKLTHAKYGGTGLGLSISRELVTLMGGEIGVQSDEGRGSRFYFEVELENPLIVGFVSSAQ